MRSIHCSVLALILVAWPLAATAQPTTPGGAPATLKVFVRGMQVGTEQVSVSRSPDGMTISGSGSLAPPVDVKTNHCEVRYDAQGRPVEASFDAIVRGQYASMHTLFADGTATTQIVQGGRAPVTKTDKVSPDAIVLLNAFFGLYEALAARLQSVQPGTELKAYVLAQAEVAVTARSVSNERIQTPGRTIAARHWQLTFANPGGPVDMELWADENGRLVRLAIPAQGFEVAREDVTSVATRTEVAPRAGDEQVRIPGNGFALAGTISRPSGPTGAGLRHPAVVLIGGSGATDRDELVYGIPIFAQLAGALADNGFLVLRYDKRGIGQSGGRAETATLQDYADDAVAAFNFLRRRKDVDGKRIALVGHSEGGWTAMIAAEKASNIAALVLIATPGVTGAQLVLAQQEHILQTSKLTPAERQTQIDLQKKIQNAVLTGSGWDSIPPDLRKRADTPWFHSFLAFDPDRAMPHVKQPILIVQGDLDRQIFASQADRLAQLARARKGRAGSEVTLVHVPGVNHLLVPATTGEVDEYAKLPDKNVSKDVLSPVVDWVKKTLGAGQKK